MRVARMVGVLAIVLGTTLPAAVPAGAATTADAPQGRFLALCRYSHSAMDDPIVYPGQPGAAHMHDFFANTTTDALSTYRSLRAGSTTCGRLSDRSAYWVPALTVDGETVRPRRINAYYTLGGHTPGTVQAFPPGFKMIAGSPTSRAASWRCQDSDGNVGALVRADEGPPPVCDTGEHLILRIRFPQCWDGVHRDSADHRSHLAYRTRRGCPSTHPVAVPAIGMNVHYPTAGGEVALSSGGPETAHADFFNAWRQTELQRLVDSCLNTPRVCGGKGP